MRHFFGAFFCFYYFCSDNWKFINTINALTMKKLTFTLLALLALCFTVRAQQYVSTEPANRNVVIEEFTGRNCGYCPIGHRITHELMEAHPGRVWAINIHCTGLSPQNYPNLNVTKGHTIANAFNFDGIPMGMVNRHSNSAAETSQFTSLTNTQLNQPAECNVGGVAIVNPETRLAQITVEIYYTGNSSVDENYLTIAMVQDSIIGSQSDYGGYNPGGWVSPGQYSHMHALRDIITPNLWGDPISPTTAGTLITKTYEYQIPTSIGSPNGVDVDINNICFIAFVTERYQGTPTRPILNVCGIEPTIGSNEPIYPMVNSVNVQDEFSCTQAKTVEVTVSNIGTETLTSLVLNATLEGETQTINWEGSLPQFSNTTIEIPMQFPFGNHNLTVEIAEANGESTHAAATCPVNCLEWANLEIQGETEQLKLMLVQDKWGAQITWEFTDSNGEVIASGGPYATLAGSTATLPHAELVTVPANECIMFTIHDSGENGICCESGNGFYKIFDSQNHLLVDGAGDFGKEASHLISVTNPEAATVATLEPRIIGDHSAVFAGTLTGYAAGVGFEYKKLTDPTSHSVPATLNGNNFTATVNDLELNTMYSVKSYALVGTTKVYGEEIHFHTWVEGVSELEKSLLMYPNPATRMLNVSGEFTSLEVYNTVGQRLFTQEVTGSAQIDLSSFSNGVYFLRVSNNGETLVKKFTVNR